MDDRDQDFAEWGSEDAVVEARKRSRPLPDFDERDNIAEVNELEGDDFEIEVDPEFADYRGRERLGHRFPRENYQPKGGPLPLVQDRALDGLPIRQFKGTQYLDDDEFVDPSLMSQLGTYRKQPRREYLPWSRYYDRAVGTRRGRLIRGNGRGIRARRVMFQQGRRTFYNRNRPIRPSYGPGYQGGDSKINNY